MSSELRFDDPQRLRVAIAGRANSGKTTLVRTLLRSPVGDIADRANVTQWPEYYMDDELGVILVDCPGFQDAGAYRAYRKIKDVDPELAEDLRNGTVFAFEDRAMEAVDACNVVMYIASLETVPTASHNQELRLLTDSAPVVGLLNKGRLAHRAHGGAGAEARVQQWSDTFAAARVPWVEYDAHVSPPGALKRVHELLMAHVPASQAGRMQEYMRNRDHRAATQRQKVAHEFARRVVAFRVRQVTATVPRAEYTEKKGEQVGTEALTTAVGEQLAGFVGHCAEVYGYRPVFEQDALSLETDVQQSLKDGGVGTAIFGALWGTNAGATLGTMVLAPLGMVGGFLLGGPAGAWAGLQGAALWGAGLGGAAGGIGGAAWGFSSDDHATLTVRVNARILDVFAERAIAWAAALAYRGFGKGEDVGVESMRELRDEVRDALAAAPGIDLTTATGDAIQAWISGILDQLHI